MAMNGRARTFVVAAAVAALLGPPEALARTAAQSTPAPIVTAENTPWYLAGEPITFAGNIYYPAGPQVFFNRFEMIRSGFYEGVPLYTRTTLEPFSVVFVPVGGGLMQPYERRRAGDVAGTAGSLTPAFPVVTAAEEASDLLPQAAAPPSRVAISIGDTSRELTPLAPGSRLDRTQAPPAAVGTTGAAVAVLPPAPSALAGSLSSAIRPKGLNGIFIEYDNRRWFSSGPAVEFSPARFVRAGDYRGFPVYTESGREGIIYVASTSGGDGLLAPYSARR